MHSRRKFLVIILLVFSCFLFGDSWNTFTVDISTALIRDSKGSFYLLPDAIGTMQFEMDTDRNIKGGIELSIDASLPFPLLLDRLFIKTRFDDLRLTLGKTRLPWGRGVLFNAGDIIWDSTSLVSDLSAQEFRTDASFLFSPYLSLGRFSFLEAVVLTPEIDFLESYMAYLNGVDQDLPKAQELRAGLHGQAKLFGADIETAYLFEGDRNIDKANHKAMMSIFFSPYIDIYASVSSSFLQVTDNFSESIYDNLQISAGTFYNHSFDSGAALSGRLEGLIFPSKEFSPLTIEERTAGAEYGLFLYPEISYSPEPIMQFYIRSMISPIDFSAMIMLGANFETYQDLNFYINTSVMIGEEQDLYHFDHDGGLFIQTGIKYIY